MPNEVDNDFTEKLAVLQFDLNFLGPTIIFFNQSLT